MNILITINLKFKVLKLKNLKIDYLIEKRISELDNQFYEEIKREKVNIIIEQKCINNKKIFNKIINQRNRGSGSKIIILHFGNERLNVRGENIRFINMLNKKYEENILLACKGKSKNSNQFDHKKKYQNIKSKVHEGKYIDSCNNEYSKNRLASKQKQRGYKYSKNKRNIKFENKIEYVVNQANFNNTVISISLDNKVYGTTYLLNYAALLAKSDKGSKINYYEKEQSLIKFDKIFELNKFNINYEKFSIINMLKIKSENINIIDFGKVEDLDFIKDILQYKFFKIIIFTTDCHKVNENDRYLKVLRFLQKHNEVVIINRREIFDRKIQGNINKFKSKVIVRNIKKNKLLKGKDV